MEMMHRASYEKGAWPFHVLSLNLPVFTSQEVL